jgi:hypothetical protein
MLEIQSPTLANEKDGTWQVARPDSRTGEPESSPPGPPKKKCESLAVGIKKAA